MFKKTFARILKKAADIAEKLLSNRVFLITLICGCAVIMILSLYSIVSSLLLMRQASVSAVPSVGMAGSPDPYFVPSPEPTALPAPLLTPVPTPEPDPESPWGWKDFDGYRFYIDDNGNAVTGLHLIDGSLHYFNRNGLAASSLGVDVSYHNKGINWEAVKAQGIDFAIIRLGYRGWETGILHPDTRFVQNLRGARAAGLKVGVYLYSTAINAGEAAAEASYALSMLNGFSLDLPVYLDTEQSGDYPHGRADRLSKSRRYEVITSFCRTIEEGGYRAGVYSGQNFLKNHVAFHTISRYPVWLASYTVYNRLPDFPYDYDMWQFTDRGVVSGIRGIADLNAVYP